MALARTQTKAQNVLTADQEDSLQQAMKQLTDAKATTDAAIDENINGILAIAMKDPILINVPCAKDPNNSSLLIRTITRAGETGNKKYLDLATTLVTHAKNLDAQNNLGETALHKAVLYGNKNSKRRNIAKIAKDFRQLAVELVKKGANCSVKTRIPTSDLNVFLENTPADYDPEFQSWSYNYLLQQLSSIVPASDPTAITKIYVEGADISQSAATATAAADPNKKDFKSAATASSTPSFPQPATSAASKEDQKKLLAPILIQMSTRQIADALVAVPMTTDFILPEDKTHGHLISVMQAFESSCRLIANADPVANTIIQMINTSDQLYSFEHIAEFFDNPDVVSERKEPNDLNKTPNSKSYQYEIKTLEAVGKALLTTLFQYLDCFTKIHNQESSSFNIDFCLEIFAAHAEWFEKCINFISTVAHTITQMREKTEKEFEEALAKKLTALQSEKETAELKAIEAITATSSLAKEHQTLIESRKKLFEQNILNLRKLLKETSKGDRPRYEEWLTGIITAEEKKVAALKTIPEPTIISEKINRMLLQSDHSYHVKLAQLLRTEKSLHERFLDHTRKGIAFPHSNAAKKTLHKHGFKTARFSVFKRDQMEHANGMIAHGWRPWRHPSLFALANATASAASVPTNSAASITAARPPLK